MIYAWAPIKGYAPGDALPDDYEGLADLVASGHAAAMPPTIPQPEDHDAEAVSVTETSLEEITSG